MFKSEADSLNIFCIYVSYSWPNGSTELADVFKETHRYPGGNKGKKMSSKIDFKKILDFLKFHGQRRTLYLVINNQLMKQLINQSFMNVLLSTFQSLDEQNKSRMSYVLTADN